MKWPYHPDLLERPVPRYTSYPTAAEFHDRVGGMDQASALERVERDAAISLYVHIPYCRDICWYCGCNTGAANRAARLAGYLDALDHEISLVSRALRGRGRVERIAFGGGSPNALPPLGFVRLLDRLITAFDAPAAQLSIELDPRTLDKAWYGVIATAQVSSASLGCQSFAPHVQKAIGRIQPLDMIERAVDSLRTAGVRSLNFDLMYGLPGQTAEDLDRTLDATLRLMPDRVALFGYAHLPSVISRQRRIDASLLPGPVERFAQAAMGYARLTDGGYQAVGFDHFARPGDPLSQAARSGRLRRNFQGFTDDGADVLVGLGASAISQLPGLLVQNEKRPGHYRALVASGTLPGRRGVARSAHDMERAHAIEQLLCNGSVDVPEGLRDCVEAALRPFVARRLASCDGSRLTILPEGLPYARAIASAFDAYRSVSVGQFSNAI